MTRLLLAALILFSPTIVPGASIHFPFVPEESKAIQSLVERIGLPVEANANPPDWQINGIRKQLEVSGIETDSLRFYAIANPDRNQIGLTFTYDQDGHIVGIRGNGPWLDNEALVSLTALPELRAISIDHNGLVGKHDSNPFDGSGLAALTDSKIQSIRIGLGFDDAGMEQAAQIKALRVFEVAHSKTTEAGVVFFEGHPNLESFSIAEMGRISEKALASIAKIPHLKKVGFRECYITYENGFAHLKPLAGQLEEIDLRMSLFSLADLNRLKADHPEAEIMTQTPEEIARTHTWIAKQLTRLAPAEVSAPLEEAIAALEAESTN